LILLAVERAIQKTTKPRISVESGHGIGKSSTLSWLMLWYLFCYKNAQIPCTAPTAPLMKDILWKEVALWLGRMPNKASDKYEWSNEYVRIAESPETWFARARTGKKENPEALAGMHADYMLYLVDEASGVAEAVFNTGEGALTGEHFIFVMISNHTRNVGYFHDSHKSDKKNWQTLSFDSRDSPIVEDGYVERIRDKHGEDSDEFRIRVMGKGPKEGAIDDEGYVQLFKEADINEAVSKEFIGKKRMGVDPAGQGSDTAEWVVRDEFKARIVATEKKSTPKTIAQKTLTLMHAYKIKPEEVFVDNFGVGADAIQEIALVGKKVVGVNVGHQPIDKDEKKLYLNLRAKAFMAVKKWFRSGGEVVNKPEWMELLTIFFRRELTDKISIMGKKKMKKKGYSSPNKADALMLTFVQDIEEEDPAYKQPAWQTSSIHEG